MTSNTLRRLTVLLVSFALAACGQGTAAPTQPPAPTATAIPATPTATALLATVEPSATPLAPAETAAPPSPTTAQAADTATAVPPLPTAVPPTATPTPPTATAVPPTPTAVPPNAQTGAQLWPQAPCSACHGPSAEGAIGPRLAGTGLSLTQLLSTVRLGKGQMPSFSESRISDENLGHIHAWLQSLSGPTPTPISAPDFPTQSLSEMWYYVNEMRIRADFAKDLPVRVASDEAGRLKVVQDYAGDGLNETVQVLDRANRALGEVPSEPVRQIIRAVIDETTQVIEHFNRARALNTYDAAWAEVAEAVRICRINTLPRATQAVRDAGLVGTVRVRVVTPGGQPIPGALITVLTAHTPVAAVADASGRATLVNVAAVPALPVKAYAEGRVYHEINVNLSPGGTMEGTIALPTLPGGNVAPTVADAAISPAQGSGDATVTFSLTATDPQGRLDLAEDQIFALNPRLGLAYVLLHAGNNRYQASVRLPGLGGGQHTWSFFAVDHECHMSQILTRSYGVQ